MLTTKVLTLSDWRPDAAPIGAAYVARNVIPGDGGYRPFPAFSALDSTPQSIASDFTEAFVAFVGDGAIDVIASTSTDLYRWDGSAWVSAASGFTDGEWRFAQWGDEIVATNPTHGFHVANVGGAFSADATPPAARHIARFGTNAAFVVLANLSGNPNAVQWSALNDRTSWVIGSKADQSDIQYMPREYGAITGLKGGSFPIVFQERAITTVRYVGGDYIFRFDTVEEELGCAASRSIQTYGSMTYFVSQEGPAVFDGTRAQLLGEDSQGSKWRRWFQEEIAGATQSPIHSAIDKKQKIIVWAWVPDEGDTSMRGLIYNFSENRAAEWIPGAEYPLLMSLPSSIASTNVLTSTVIGSYSGNALQTRVSGVADRARTEENTLVIGSIDANDNLGKFAGSALEATFETEQFLGELSPKTANSPRTRLGSIYPIVNVEPTGIYGQVITRPHSVGDTETVGSEVRGDARGMIVTAAPEGRTHRARFRIPAGSSWTHAQGAQIPNSPGARQ